MILYHGSNMVIDRIDLEKSKPNKDLLTTKSGCKYANSRMEI